MKSPLLPFSPSFLLPVAALILCLPTSQASETYPDDQDPSSLFFLNPPYPWVHYDVNYGQPGRSAYKGVWRTPNSWPGKDSPGGTASNVTIRHEVNLNNWPYYLGGPLNPGVLPFPGLPGGFLEVAGLHLKPGGFLYSNLEVLSLDGMSTWEQGFIAAGGWSDGTVSGIGRIQNKGTVAVKNGGSVIGRSGAFHNTNRVVVDSSNGTPSALDIQGGHAGFYNESGVLPNTSVAEIELKGAGSSLGLASGGGGGFPIIYNAGVLRKTGSGTGTIANAVRNYRNYQQGGTLNFTGSGKYYLNPGSFLSTTTPEVPRTFNSAPGVFDCRGGRLHGPFTNAGEITVSAPTIFDRSFIGDNPITNAGTIRCLATSAGGDGSWSIVLSALVRIPCTASSVLAFDIAGRPTDFANWARLLETGQTSITYDGTLRINFGDFTPVDGDRWLVIQNDGGIPNSGDFDSVEFTNVPAGFTPTFEKLTTGIRVGLNAAPAPLTYATWAAAQNFPTPAAAGFEVDHDNDGFTNGMECALGTDPKDPSAFPEIAATEMDSGGDLFFAARIKRPAAAQRATDLQYIVERSDSLATWTTDHLILESGPPNAQNMETLTARPSEPMAYTSRAFIRFRIALRP
jgi:hypothetical protein